MLRKFNFPPRHFGWFLALCLALGASLPLSAEEGDEFYEGFPIDEIPQTPDKPQPAPILKLKKKNPDPYEGEDSEEASQPEYDDQPRDWDKEPGDAQLRNTFEKPKPVFVRTRQRPMSLSFLFHTPLVLQNSFDKRFSALGGDALFSIQLIPLGKSSLHGELGFGLTIANLSIPAPPVDFSHIYMNIPFRLRLVMPAGSKFYFEVIGGLEMKVFEYDSRFDDGAVLVSDFFGLMDPELALGFSFSVAKSLDIRLVAGLLYLAGGIEWLL